MGQVCSRDDNVDNQAGDANPTIGAQQKQPEPMRPAAVANPAPAPAPAPVNTEAPIPEKAKPIAASQIEDMHSEAKLFEPYTKMHQLHMPVQRRLDTMVPLKADSHPALKAKFSTVAPGTQIVRNTKTFATYQGQMNRGVPHGFGRFITPDGSIIEGFFSEGQPDGYIRRITAPHAATYEGEFKNGLANGNGKQIDEKGVVTECKSWVNGVATGITIIKNPQGLPVFQGSMENGRKSGQCNFYDEKEKATLIGNFKNDVLEGKGSKRYDNGQVYEGDFKNGLENGTGTLIFVDERKFTGPFSNGKANGEGTLTTDTGKVIKQTWKDGRRV